MKSILRWIVPLLKAYVVIGLVLVAIFSTPTLSFIPSLMAAAYLFFWWRPLRALINLIADFFMFFGFSILFSPVTGSYYAVLISLPVLVLLIRDLETTAVSIPHQKIKYQRYLTRVGIALPLITVLMFIIAVLFSNLALLLNSCIAFAYLATLTVIAFLNTPIKPLTGNPIHQRMVAGSKATVTVTFTDNTRLGGSITLESPVEWLTIKPDIISLDKKEVKVENTLSPPLSGPSSIELRGIIFDRWGLTQTKFEVKSMTLHVIPRARYAEWLAKRYLTETKAGMLPLISTVGSLRPLYGLRAGVEYYGSQLYQPGDSIKNIDWKRSIKYNKLISKEFAEFRGQPVIMLVNLAVGDAEEADEQAYKTIVAALSLAGEQIPTSIAGYDHEDVRIVTNSLQPRLLVTRSLEMIKEIKQIGKPVKYLGQADIRRLRANVKRLNAGQSEGALALAQLLRIEYKVLKNRAQSNPATRSLAIAFEKNRDQRATIIVISQMNHDAEAVMFGAIGHENKGSSVLII
ncbi:MAG: DUF58 domain-containing protein [Dehalococcoidales bacterium]|nr:DUF58 domain-containing protein [Dehalococcoidales bacterium]